MDWNEDRMLRKNDVYTVTVSGFSAEGLGVCRIDGQVVFVAGALEGETPDVRIVKVQARHAYGRIEKILTPSPHRIVPDCPHAKLCGGCALRIYNSGTPGYRYNAASNNCVMLHRVRLESDGR